MALIPPIPPNIPGKMPGKNHNLPSKKKGKQNLKETKVSRSKINPLRMEQPSQIVPTKGIRHQLAMEEGGRSLEDDLIALKYARKTGIKPWVRREVKNQSGIRKEDFDRSFVHKMSVAEGLKFLENRENGDYIIIKQPQNNKYYLLVKDKNGISEMKEELPNDFHSSLENDVLMNHCKHRYGGLTLVGISRSFD